MTRPEETAETLQHVQAMIDLVPIRGLDGPPKAAAPPAPDAEICIAGRRIGVEHTRIMDGRIAAGDNARTWLRKKLRAVLAAAGIVAHVDLRLSQASAADLHDHKPDIDLEVTAIAAIVHEAIPVLSEGGCVRYEQLDEDIDLDLEIRDLAGRATKYVLGVWIRRSKELSVSTRGPGNMLRARAIRVAVDRKAAKVAGYREHGYDEVWLLVVGSTGPGGSIDIHEAEGSFASEFDRIFFLELFEEQCVELEVTRLRNVLA